MPEISIIIPVYNGAAWLDAAVDSVQAQSFPDWEMILVDDGSTDASPAICDARAEKDLRIRCIHKQNEGVAIARKTGTEASSGRYLMFLDCDDTLNSGCLAAAAEAIRNSQPDIVSFGFEEEQADGSVRLDRCAYQGAFSRKDIEESIFPWLIHDAQARYYCPSLCGSAFARHVIDGNMIADSRATIGEDGACLIPSVYRAQHMVFLEECFYRYRYNAASATKGRRLIPWDNAQLIAEHIAARVDLNRFGFREQLDRKIVHDVFNICASRFSAGKGYRETAKEIVRETGREFYRRAIKNARFSGSPRASLMQFALKHHLVFLIYLYAKKDC